MGSEELSGEQIESKILKVCCLIPRLDLLGIIRSAFVLHVFLPFLPTLQQIACYRYHEQQRAHAEHCVVAFCPVGSLSGVVEE